MSLGACFLQEIIASMKALNACWYTGWVGERKSRRNELDFARDMSLFRIR